jgi:hypothetical protein
MKGHPALFALLGLLHPKGAGIFERGDEHGTQGEPAPLVLLDVGGAKRIAAKELIRMLDTALDELEPGGLLAVVAPRLRRSRVAAQLRVRGLEVTAVAIRGSQAGEQLASVDWRAVSFALSLSAGRNRRHRFVASIPRVARSRLRFLLPRVALLGYAPDAPPAQWLYRMEPSAEPSGPVVATLSPERDRAYLFRFSATDHAPTGVAKVGLTKEGAEVLTREAASLRTFASGAREAGAEVADLIDFTRIGARPVILESFVDGRHLARVLASEPMRADELLEQLSHWLARWGALTASMRLASPAFVAAALLDPAEALAADLPNDFFEIIRVEAARLNGTVVLNTAAHNDLTMWNVLVGKRGRVAVLDWEEATDATLPLTDLFYALADGVAAATGYSDRLGAFRACFRKDGAFALRAQYFLGINLEALELGDDAIASAFISCWLRHAHNDSRRSVGTEGFLSLLRDVAAAPNAYWPLEAVAGAD